MVNKIELFLGFYNNRGFCIFMHRGAILYEQDYTNIKCWVNINNSKKLEILYFPGSKLFPRFKFIQYD